MEMTREKKDVVLAVLSEPRSAQDSQLTGKITGNFGNLAPQVGFSHGSAAAIQEVAAEFPTRRNREIILPMRESNSG
jgi:hypothetical protein